MTTNTTLSYEMAVTKIRKEAIKSRYHFDTLSDLADDLEITTSEAMTFIKDLVFKSEAIYTNSYMYHTIEFLNEVK